MKTLITIAKTLLVVAAFAVTQSSSAQNTDNNQEQKKLHIKIVTDDNGNKQVIDRTFNSKAELDAFLKDKNIDLQQLPPLPEAGDTKTDGKEKGKMKHKAEKKIIITEKELNTTGNNSDLNIEFENFPANERAALIQEMLDKKDSKVAIKQMGKSPVNPAQERISIIEANGEEDGNTQLDIDFENFNAKDRADLIQEMMDKKDTKLIVNQQGNNTAQDKQLTVKGNPHTDVANLQAVNNLKLFPNPNNGQFHISFSTGQPTNVQLRMMDMSGKQIYKEKIKENNGAFDKDIDIRAAISKGSYVLEAEANGQKITTQVVVQ